MVLVVRGWGILCWKGYFVHLASALINRFYEHFLGKRNGGGNRGNIDIKR